MLLLTWDKTAEQPWPWDSIDIVHSMPDLRRRPDVLYAVSYMTWGIAIEAIVSLDDYADVAQPVLVACRLRNITGCATKCYNVAGSIQYASSI